MTSATAFAPRSLQQQVLRIIGQRKSLRVRSLRLNLRLTQLYFDLLDVVDIILELESCFHITIPDDVPFVTLGDFVNYVATHTTPPAKR
ncbi:acyl carrier protein [Hymenobacter terrenus]|uniref:acyl carrier protein n=1 Tax=Hymenobacter terrenus TaxID=1629124 RepID=UPI000619774F|nr:acyl carrier protein [Hymenobacter terrenus]